MGKILVLAEKPSVGRELARALGAKKKLDGALAGDRYIVTWALGHLVTLAEPEHYGDQYKTWSLATLPILPDKMALKVIPETAKQYRVVKNLLSASDTDSLIIATDAGREGELVARWIIAKAGFKKPIKRLWISSQTDRAIRDGFQHLKDGTETLNLYRSAQSRAEADWLVGLNVTRALTCKYNASLSAGRVQTPTLALIVNREREIRNFKPRDYYTVKADLGAFFATYQDGQKQTAIYNEAQAQAIAAKIKNAVFTVDDVKVKAKAIPPPLLYDLTTLQRDANKRYRLSPKETLNIMQRLYENHKVLTYPRTDSAYLSADIVPTLPERLAAVAFGEFGAAVGEIRRQRWSIAKQVVNDNKVSDHHAIIPTEEPPNLLKMSDDEKKIYLLVVARFLASFFPAYQYEAIAVTLSAEEASFKASGRVVTEKGWHHIYEQDDEEEENEEQTLPKLTKGVSLTCRAVQLKAQKTKAPSRFTEASLLAAMENPAKYIEDRQLKSFIGGGLGTPATRADIIEKLYHTFYMEKQDNVIVPTTKGMQLIDLVPPDLKEPLLTAKWEQVLDGIAKGTAKDSDFLADVQNYTKDLVKTVAQSTATYKPDNVSRTPCPQCGKMMLKVTGKKGKLLVCPDRECGGRQHISLTTRTRCPQCHKTMEIFGEGDKRLYVCTCGFRERVTSFHKKREESAGGSKRDVQTYLKKQAKQQDSENLSPLALALQEAMKKS